MLPGFEEEFVDRMSVCEAIHRPLLLDDVYGVVASPHSIPKSRLRHSANRESLDRRRRHISSPGVDSENEVVLSHLNEAIHDHCGLDGEKLALLRDFLVVVVVGEDHIGESRLNDCGI